MRNLITAAIAILSALVFLMCMGLYLHTEENKWLLFAILNLICLHGNLRKGPEE